MTEFTADGVDRTTTLKVSGLTCGHCVAHVTEELEALDGVKDVSVLLNKGGSPPSPCSPTSASRTRPWLRPLMSRGLHARRRRARRPRGLSPGVSTSTPGARAP